jgi:hypothetical protein
MVGHGPIIEGGQVALELLETGLPFDEVVVPVHGASQASPEVDD